MQHLQPNTTLQGGKYRIERVLGQGGFGITYLAIQTSLNRYVAIKELFVGGSGQAINERRGNQVVVTNSVNQQSFNQQKAKFKKEALRLANLNHPNLVKVHEFFEENGTAYYVMDYIDGESLRTKLNREGKLSERLVLKYINQILPALDAAHKQNIWHLDIKPENIMVDRYGHVYLIDFGASKHIERTGTLTTSLVLAYTPGYCAPELLELSHETPENYIRTLKDIGPWTDIYALGATMYNLLTDNIPPSSNKLYQNGRNAFIFSSNISSSTQDLIVWMMKPNREERPQSVQAISYRLDKASTGGGEDTIVENRCSARNNVRKRRETRTRLYIGLTIIIMMVLVVGYLYNQYNNRKENNDRQAIVNTIINNMVFDEGGSFEMGISNPKDYARYQPKHKVTLSPFYIGKYEITQKEWTAIMNYNPSYYKGDNLPVEQISWNDCQEFIKRLNDMTNMVFRLPTEAEWEYAAKGGMKTHGYIYSGSNNIDDVGWCLNAKETREVGHKLPNELGLYDMSGNVWEWCQDNWHSYSSESQVNPVFDNTPDTSKEKMVRGGEVDAWFGNDDCRVFERKYHDPNYRGNSLKNLRYLIGLRLVCSKME